VGQRNGSVVGCVACSDRGNWGGLWETEECGCSRCACAQSNIVSTEADQLYMYVFQAV
jgi:hypothetical protein